MTTTTAPKAKTAKTAEAPVVTKTPRATPVPTAEFIAVVRDWANQHQLCNDVEREMQRKLGLRFVSRSFDYMSGDYDLDDRLTLRADQPETLDPERISAALSDMQKAYGRRGYHLDDLTQQVATKLGIDVVHYNDTYTLTWTRIASADELVQAGWNGLDGMDGVRRFSRYNIAPTTAAVVTVVPDPKRPATTTEAAA